MMRAFSLRETARIVEGEYQGPDLRFNQVSTDTRTLRPGDLFVALRGERFDGHQFLLRAVEAGAVAAIVDTRMEASLAQIRATDTLRALGLLAGANRRASDAPLVAVTGSSGKTTVKEMLRAILAARGNTLATEGNLNNAIGVPLTLFRLSPEHEFAVIELGASGLGEIAWTTSLARPDVAVITNAGQAHLEGFGSYDNVVIGKGEIIDGLGPRGTLVLNHDDPAFPRWRQRCGSRPSVSVSLSSDSKADYRPRELSSSEKGQHFTICGPQGGEVAVTLPLLGRHNITNALLAAAAAHALGASDSDIVRGLAQLGPVGGRLQPLRLAPGLVVLDDSYNANPGSMRAALEVLANCEGARVALLGDMAELGEDAPRMHREIGVFARSLGIDELWVRGNFAEEYAAGFGSGAFRFDGIEAVDELPERSRPLSILVKGSRSSAMDRVVARLKEKVKS